MTKFELVMCERDANGNKNGGKISIKTNDAEWMARQAERIANKGVKKVNRAEAEAEFFYGDV